MVHIVRADRPKYNDYGNLIGFDHVTYKYTVSGGGISFGTDDDALKANKLVRVASGEREPFSESELIPPELQIGSTRLPKNVTREEDFDYFMPAPPPPY